MKLEDLGNIYSSGNRFTTKAALLQSCFRYEKNEASGKTMVRVFDHFDLNEKKIYRSELKEYGHIVNEGELKNKNFYFHQTFDYAHQRVITKNPDETIKKDRLFNNLLSSMPLAFNLFHPLMMLLESSPHEVTKIVSALFPALKIKEVEKIDIEFIPLPITSYTNDKSAMDAVIFFKNNNDKSNIISIEVKYTDTLGSNKAKENKLKVDAALATGYFTTDGIKHIHGGCTQIYRNFLLTEKYRMVHKLENSYSIILAPKDHPSTEWEINSLKKYFNESCPDSKLKKYTLEDFTRIISDNINEDYKPWINWFNNRYLAFDKVNKLLEELTKK